MKSVASNLNDIAGLCAGGPIHSMGHWLRELTCYVRGLSILVKKKSETFYQALTPRKVNILFEVRNVTSHEGREPCLWSGKSV